ncbi:DUF84 family protein [Cytobacillus purgationiresistens]|uniref:Probable inosine/xanthosine triphosphatase n=1 Tax=Cytobacillus purgationiresistens TaxID=863449 RepID=A0ABU0ALS2_9BACI|nr:DUF84 family protein [Cytobacillus purgationiresistens]MDQ0272221.1 inosine/xanthosine triphosphatase [Cytobacillus purgationiresistens]
MRVVIGSKNPAKIKAIETIFSQYKAEFIVMDIPSGVAEQPFSDAETIKGAVNRAADALYSGEGQIGIGLEGGVEKTENGLFLCNWGALVEKDEPPIIAGGARILLPEEVADRLVKGEELGPVMDDYAKKQNIRHNEGAIGVFTNGQINRADMFTHVAKLLLGQYEYRHVKRR